MAYHGGMSEPAETIAATPPPGMRLAPATETPSIAQAPPPRDASAERESVIPVHKSDIIDALIEHGSLESQAEHDQFRQFCKVLGAIYHYEHFEELERMREDYHYFSPDLDPHAHFDHATLDHAYADLSKTLTAVLKDANFIELTHDEIEQAHKEHPTMRVNVKVALEAYVAINRYVSPVAQFGTYGQFPAQRAPTRLELEAASWSPPVTIKLPEPTPIGDGITQNTKWHN